MSHTLIPVPYDTKALRPRILHIGFGAFARAHPMVYLHHGLEKVGGDWGVVAARLNSGVEALTALDEGTVVIMSLRPMARQHACEKLEC